MKNRAASGRKHALSERQQRQIVRLSREGNLSLNQLANKYGVSHMTVYRVIKRSLGAVPELEGCDKGTSQPQAAGHGKFPRIYSSYG